MIETSEPVQHVGDSGLKEYTLNVYDNGCYMLIGLCVFRESCYRLVMLHM